MVTWFGIPSMINWCPYTKFCLPSTKSYTYMGLKELLYRFQFVLATAVFHFWVILFHISRTWTRESLFPNSAEFLCCFLVEQGYRHFQQHCKHIGNIVHTFTNYWNTLVKLPRTVSTIIDSPSHLTKHIKVTLVLSFTHCNKWFALIYTCAALMHMYVHCILWLIHTCTHTRTHAHTHTHTHICKQI